MKGWDHWCYVAPNCTDPACSFTLNAEIISVLLVQGLKVARHSWHCHKPGHQHFVGVSRQRQLLYRIGRRYLDYLNQMWSEVAQVNENNKHCSKFPNFIKHPPSCSFCFPFGWKWFCEQYRIYNKWNFIPENMALFTLIIIFPIEGFNEDCTLLIINYLLVWYRWTCTWSKYKRGACPKVFSLSLTF